MPGGLRERIDEGRLLLGSPASVLKQIEAIRRDLGAGVIDLTVTHQMGEKTNRSIELIAEKILPTIRGW
jgi:alkanesulfonate monooxygenase SsuD/methylene tetrahydromethanopterin reductase-like flavin-dependent oxidoreductase (luciferase family)